MDELKKLLENAGVQEAGFTKSLEWHADNGSGNTFSVYLDERDQRMYVEQNGRNIAMAVLSGDGVKDTSIQNSALLMEALWAFALQDDTGR